MRAPIDYTRARACWGAEWHDSTNLHPCGLLYAHVQEYAAVLSGMASFSPSSFIIDELWLTDLLTMIQVGGQGAVLFAYKGLVC